MANHHIASGVPFAGLDGRRNKRFTCGCGERCGSRRFIMVKGEPLLYGAANTPADDDRGDGNSGHLSADDS